MQASIQAIPLLNLSLAFIPVAIVIGIMFRWSLKSWHAMYAVTRMLIQLLLIGFFLLYIFETQYSSVILLILSLMLILSSWIALNPLQQRNKQIYIKVLLSIAIGGISTLALVTQSVLQLEPWYLPRYVLPIGGMIFANAMNSVSLAAERLESEIQNGLDYYAARKLAFQTALIPQINTMLATGLVSLPGMMTGQILSGVSPLIAVRYQVMVMCMIFGSSGISAACYLYLNKPRRNI